MSVTFNIKMVDMPTARRLVRAIRHWQSIEVDKISVIIHPTDGGSVQGLGIIMNALKDCTIPHEMVLL